MEDKINEIYDLIYNDQTTKNPKVFIKKVEPYIKIIEKDYSGKEYDLYYKTTRLLSDYSIQLVNDGYSKKAVAFLDKAIARIEKDIKLKNKNLFEETIYETLIWNRGMNNFNLNKKKVAKDDFKRLIKSFPNNDKYQNWYKACSDRNYGKIEWSFAGIAIIGLFSSFFLDQSDGIINMIALYVMIFGFLGGITISFYRKIRLR